MFQRERQGNQSAELENQSAELENQSAELENQSAELGTNRRSCWDDWREWVLCRSNENKGSSKTPKGLQALSPGQASEASGTLGSVEGRPMRPRRGQKQRQERSNTSTEACKIPDVNPPFAIYPSLSCFKPLFHCFCPLRGRIGRFSTKPGVSLASLACPGLWAYNPFGVLLERLMATLARAISSENVCPLPADTLKHAEGLKNQTLQPDLR